MKMLLHICLMLVFMVSMTAPAFAAPCMCDHQKQASAPQKSESAKPCHGKATEESPQTQQDGKSCCEGKCNCACVHTSTSFTTPKPVATAVTISLVDYLPGAMQNYSTLAIAPPVSPPKA